MTKHSWILFVGVVFAMLLFASPANAQLSPNVQSTTITFTSTANFDAGTKSSASGNYQIETNTDNLGIATGSFELGSGKGDSFTFADADGVTSKWTTSPSSCVAGTQSIAGGVYDISGAATGGFVSSFTLSGDVDVRMKFHKVSGSTGTLDFAVNDAQVCEGSVFGTNGVLIEQSNSNGNSQAYTVSSGSPTTCGSLVASLNTDPLWYRFSRSGTSWTIYYSGDGSSWTTMGSGCTQSTGNLYVAVRTGATHRTFDDYHLAAGTVNSGGYRTAGTWTSAGQTATSAPFRQVTVTYSGVSGSNFITATSLIDGSGVYKFIDNTDLTTGTTHTYTMDKTMTGSWKVEVNLTGGNAGTPNIAQVDVVTNVPPVITNPITSDSATSSVHYSRDFAVSDSDDTPTWSFVTNAVGLSINTVTGVVSGTVNAKGTYYVNVTVSDGLDSDFNNYTLVVNPQICGFNSVGLGNLTLLFALIIGAGILAFVLAALKFGSGGIGTKGAIPVNAFIGIVIGFVVVITIAVIIVQNLRCV